MDSFKGQSKGEGVLFFGRENLISFLINSFGYLLVLLFLNLIIIVVTYFMELGSIGVIVGLLIVDIIYLLVLFSFWKQTYLIITNKRILKFVKDGLFSKHYKELALLQLNQKSAKTGGILGKIFGFGECTFVGKDEKSLIWFRGLKYNDEVSMYVSRLKDYHIENPDTEIKDLKGFIPRSERKG